MTTAYDIQAEQLIKKLANKLKEEFKISPPEWSKWVKTGVHKERHPDNPDWWHIRTAAILRKVYMRGPIGVERLRALFGGKRNRLIKPYKSRKGSGSIIRRALHQLEEIELIKRVEGKGRVVTPKGQSIVDNTAYELYTKQKKLK
jgi:small subunit ribosomal protein S19e